MAVMPLVEGRAGRHATTNPAGRIANTKKLLRTAGAHHERAADRQLVRDHPADSARGVPAGRRGVGPRARVSRAPAPRRAVRHDLRPQHDLDPVVRRRVGDGRPAEPRAALSARATAWRRSGPRRRGPLVLLFTAITFLITMHLQGGRRRPGRRLRDRRAGADDVRGGRRHARWCGIAGRSSSASG